MNQFVHYIHRQVYRYQVLNINRTICQKKNELTLQHVGRYDRQYFSNILCKYLKQWISYNPSHECNEQIDP